MRFQVGDTVLWDGVICRIRKKKPRLQLFWIKPVDWIARWEDGRWATSIELRPHQRPVYFAGWLRNNGSVFPVDNVLAYRPSPHRRRRNGPSSAN